MDQFFNQVTEHLDAIEQASGSTFNLEYLKTVYNTVCSELTTSMIVKDESVEMDVITFRWINRTHHMNVLCDKIQDHLCNEVLHLILQGNCLQEKDRESLCKCITRENFPKLTSITLTNDNYSTLVKSFIVSIPLQSIKLVNCILNEVDLEGIVVASQNTLKLLWIESKVI